MDEGLLGRAFDLDRSLEHVTLVPLDLATVRVRAPGIVCRPLTYDYEGQTNRPAPGGLFDEEVFGEGASLELPTWTDEDTLVRERATRFGRIVLRAGVPHPWQSDVVLEELPVLPPDLRPIALRDGKFLISDVNLHYREVLTYDMRLRKLHDINAPPTILEATRAALAKKVVALFDNERQFESARDDGGRVLVSIRGLLRPDARTALATLDQAVGQGTDPSRPMPLRLHRTVAALFALGFVVRAAGSID
jgi:DNA-directed RNA polymerase beta' subunit